MKEVNIISFRLSIRKELFEGENIRTRDTDKAQSTALEQNTDNVAANVDMVISEKDDEDK